jgi:hypothetical protein
MKKRLIAAAIGVCAFITPTALAADHQDGPATTADPAADITDVFVWMSSDTTNVNFVMDVFPNAGPASGNPQYSNTAKYTFHTLSYSAYPVTPLVPADVGQLTCTFGTSSPQMVSCWLVVNTVTVDYATGDATATTGLVGQNGLMTIYTGLRDDPFFFNLSGFQQTLTDVVAAVPELIDAGAFNVAGCPKLDAPTSAALVTQLASNGDGGMPYDHFALFNTLSLVVQVQSAVITSAGHQTLAVWASTNL